MSKSDPRSDQFPRKFGNYHLLGPLAQGGMGALYLATTGDRGLERLLVIKTVLPHLADQEYVARFRDEAKIVVKLSHGNLIPVFDAGQVGGELFLAMDFVEGKDLRAVWNRCARKAVAFPIDVAVYIAKELCRGLGYAHAYEGLELVHRDVSPPNVLISYAGEVKLTDFGLASSTLKLEKTAPGIIYGKVAYMSPEQARGETLDGGSDLYAAGIILWELLTGRQLFPPGKEQPHDLLKRARDPEVPAPSQRAPRVPPELDALVLAALAPNREDRYPTCEAFRDALGGWLAKESPTTDASTLEAFLGKLFAEDATRERAERQELIEGCRERTKTLPPSDELRRLFEQVGAVDLSALEAAADRRREDLEEHDSRRSADRGTENQDRRQRPGRRIIDRTVHGVAVDVPEAGPGGRTVVSRPDTGGAALAEAQETAPESSSFVGQIIDGRYLIEQLIGEGGMGRVYLAEHVEIGKRVAVKILHPVYGRMPDLVERFRREARAASRIGHPNIVDVTDSGTTADDSVYFVMEHLEGVELAAVIDREGALDMKRALRISGQICRALSAAHAAGIIHRDLKPENVFLTIREGSSDFVKILDFGIAKTTEAEEARKKRLTHPGMAMGTPEYMAPEQAAGRPADARCDVYAVGAILYEMLTGSPPYEGENFMEILTKKATVDPAPPRELRADLPEVVEALVVRAMARDPEDRPPSMEAFEYELTKCLSGRGAAVAGILGMKTDPGLASLAGHGMPAREGIDVDAATAPSDLSPPRSNSNVGYNFNFDEPTEHIDVPDVTGSGLRVLGWTLFSLLLVAGGAAVLFVASGEKRGAAGVIGAEDAAPVEVERERGAVDEAAKPDRPDKADRRHGEGKGDRAREPKGEQRARGGDDKKRAATPQSERKSGVAGVPKSSRDARDLLEEAHADIAEMRWDDAREKFRRVISGSHLERRGYLGLAEVAFQTKNHDEAIEYAKKAGKSVDARMMLGHAYFRKGAFEAALEQYEAVLAIDPGHKEAQRTAKTAREKLGR